MSTLAREGLKMRLLRSPERFGNSMQLWQQRPNGTRAIVREMEMITVEPGKSIPDYDKTLFPIEEDNLRDLGEWLIGQGLITAPVTDKERQEHEILKAKYEAIENEVISLRRAMESGNRALSEVASTMKVALDKL